MAVRRKKTKSTQRKSVVLEVIWGEGGYWNYNNISVT
jgi:hypothetical protein